MTKTQAAWLAAAIDGEGSIGLYNYGREGRRVLIQLANTDRRFVVQAQRIIGAGWITPRRHQALHKGRKTVYHYSLKGSKRCYPILRTLVPWLIVKRTLAQRIVRELENRPFGRWLNATRQQHRLASEMLRHRWAHPASRRRMLKGIKRSWTPARRERHASIMRNVRRHHR